METLAHSAARCLSVLLLSCLAFSCSVRLTAQSDEPKFVDLFDGESLAGFEQKGGKAKYHVEDGCIVGTTVPSTPNSFLCTKRHYGDFILDYEFLVDDRLNSGVQIRSHSIPEHRKGRVHGYQVEIDPSKRAWTAGIYDESRRGWLNDLKNNEPARKAFKSGEWNRIRVIAAGASIKTWLNGVAAADLVDSMTQSGFIALQVHGVGGRKDPIEVRWRNLRIADLGRHVWKPLFDGETLKGWHKEGGGRWSVEDGALVARNEKSQPAHGHLFLDTPVSDFTIRLKYKCVSGNSGFYFRAAKAEGNVGIKGMQAEIDPKNDVGGLYETRGRAWVVKPDPKAIQKYFKPGQWNEMTVTAKGRRVVVHVNGRRSAEVLDDPGRVEGLVALQLHGGDDVEVYLKDIETLVARDGQDPASKEKARKKPKRIVKEAGWIPLFNGKDLTGWKVKITGHELEDNFGDTFRVEDGLLKVSYDRYENFDGKFGHLFHEREFANYKLRAEYRFVGEQAPGGPGWAFRNSGLMVHGQSAKSMGKDQKFPASIEVQLLGGRADGKRSTANLCTPGTHVVMNGKLWKRHCVDSSSKTYRGDRWVTVEVEVRDNRVKHVVDGETVLEYTDPQLDERDGDAKKLLAAGSPKMLRRGTISLQSESHPIEFRKVEIMELPSEVEAPAPWTDLVGKELSQHWETEGNWKQSVDGVISLTPREGERGWNRFGAYLWLKGEYRDFEFEFDYMVQKRGNSGFYFHVGDRKSPVAKGIEVQIYDSHGKGEKARLTDHDSGGIIPGIPPKKNAAKPAGEWNRFRVVCRGADLTVELNGELVNALKLTHKRLANRPASGAIGFQDHALPLALRNIRIRGF